MLEFKVIEDRSLDGCAELQLLAVKDGQVSGGGVESGGVDETVYFVRVLHEDFGPCLGDGIAGEEGAAVGSDGAEGFGIGEVKAGQWLAGWYCDGLPDEVFEDGCVYAPECWDLAD